jgi:hypothetical protein
LRIYKN